MDPNRTELEHKRAGAVSRIRWILRIAGAVVIFFGGISLLAFVVLGGRGNLIEGVGEVAAGVAIVYLGRWLYNINIRMSQPWPE
jgi:hypothetical protein